MQYAIIVYETDADLAARTDPTTGPEHHAAYMNYAKALTEAGVRGGGAGLMPTADATTVRIRGGERIVQDGPFADTKDRLGGFFLIEVENLDKALAWAARCPSAATGSAEIRPLLPSM